MKFKIIPNEQTPEVYKHRLANKLMETDLKMLHKFLVFARKQYNCAGLSCNQVALD